MRHRSARMQAFPFPVNRIWAALLLFAPLAGCSADQPAIPSEPEWTRPTQFSADDRRAAQALSIGNQETLASAATPYNQALLCSLALGSLNEQLQERGILDAAQQRAFAQMQALFDRQVRQRGGGKTQAEIALDREQVATDTPDPSTRAQIAIGCLRRLQQGAA